MHNEEELTIAEFARTLWKAFCEAGNRKPRGEGRWEDGFEIAQRHGWVAPEVACQSSEILHRNEAARIVHEFLRRELGEPDEENWDEAKKLKDLYDCRTCVAHVAQVFCKGIMTATDGVFGQRVKVTRTEAFQIARRCVDATQRDRKANCREESPQGPSHGGATPRRLSKTEAEELMAGCSDLLCIDVRTPGEYARGSLNGFVGHPLLSLMEDPTAICPDYSRPILLWCDGGYRSEIAANFLSESGYRRIYYSGWENS